MSVPTKADINRLGEALREGALTPELLANLDEYRNSFQPAIAEVLQTLNTHRRMIGLEPLEFVLRPSKATPSIVAKLIRQPTLKFNQIQDIAGIRTITFDRDHQNAGVAMVSTVFEAPKIVDRRVAPSYGYRAVHVVVKAQGKPVEIQIRTHLQHVWAHTSERLSDKLGHDFKYGKAQTVLYQRMLALSDEIHQLEVRELALKRDSNGNPSAEESWQMQVDKASLFRRLGEVTEPS